MEAKTEAPPTAAEETILNPEEILSVGYDRPTKQARTAIFAIAIVQIIYAISYGFAGAQEQRLAIFIEGAVISLIFCGLGFLANRKPYTAILSALIFYIVLLLLEIFLDPESMVKGILMKIIVIIYLAKGLSNAKENQRVKKIFRG